MDKYRIEILLFLLLVVCYSYVWHKPSWNDLGRYDLMMAIAEHGTVSIDAYQQNTGDKAIFNGHYYSDKGPAPAFFGVPIYWLLNRFQSLLGFTDVDHILKIMLWFTKLTIIRILIISIPSALLGVCFYRFLLTFSNHPRFALLLTCGYSLGTMAFPYSTLFYGHQLAAALIFFSFYLLYRLRLKESVNPKEYLMLFFSGFLAGWAILTEYPTILVVVLLLIYAAVIRRKTVPLFILGLVIPILILLYYNYLCSGNPFQFGYFQVAGEEFHREMVKGIAGVTYPKPFALFGITVSPYRGLLLINPILLLSIPGYYFLYRKKAYRPEFWLSLAAVILFFLFNASYYMWWGGWGIGPRHLIPILPFLAFPIAFIAIKRQDGIVEKGKRLSPYLVYFLVLLSVLFMFIGTMIDPQVPDTIRRLSWSPLFGYSLPHLVSGDIYANPGIAIGLTGFASTIPLLALLVVVFAYLFPARTNTR